VHDDGTGGAKRLNLVDWNAVFLERIHWLLRHRLPFGEYTSIEGAGGIGKTTAAIDIIARFTTGRPMPDGSVHEPGNVLLIAEEDRRSIIKARLLAAGADLSRVHLVSSVDADEHFFTLPADGLALLETVRDLDAKIVVIDALFNHFDQDINPNRAVDVRRALRPLGEVAHLTRAAVAGIRHWTKTRGAASDRGNGSADIGNLARSVISVAPHPSEEGRFLAIAGKANLARRMGAMSYQLVPTTVTGDGETVEVARVEWGADVEITANELANADVPSAEERAKIDVAGDFVVDFLSSGPRPSSEVIEAGRKLEIAMSTLARAADRRGVIKTREGFPSKSTWSLPVESPVDSSPPMSPKPELTEQAESTGYSPQSTQIYPVNSLNSYRDNSRAREQTESSAMSDDARCERFDSHPTDPQQTCRTCGKGWSAHQGRAI
jgi:hypothetical protein